MEHKEDYVNATTRVEYLNQEKKLNNILSLRKEGKKLCI